MRFRGTYWFGNGSLDRKMVFIFLSLLLGGDISYRKKKGERGCEQGQEVADPSEETFILFFLVAVVHGASANPAAVRIAPISTSITSLPLTIAATMSYASSGPSQDLVQLYFSLNLVLLYSNLVEKRSSYLSAAPTWMM